MQDNTHWYLHIIASDPPDLIQQENLCIYEPMCVCNYVYLHMQHCMYIKLSMNCIIFYFSYNINHYAFLPLYFVISLSDNGKPGFLCPSSINM